MEEVRECWRNTAGVILLEDTKGVYVAEGIEDTKVGNKNLGLRFLAPIGWAGTYWSCSGLGSLLDLVERLLNGCLAGYWFHSPFLDEFFRVAQGALGRENTVT